MRRTDEPDAGFTLLELLVVIIIIGILAAVAIPVFLRQRTKAYDTAARSDMRNAAEFEEVFLHDHNKYGLLTDIQTDGNGLRVSRHVTLSLLHYDGVNGYCLSAKHDSSTVTWYYDSQGGGMLPRGAGSCPVTSTGPVGDFLTG